ncbi:MAG TPA: 1,4-alpha-glucan branching protein GlgB [Synergistaceae bacterium]|nr:1,4-alpha-glucan branching protein GlgB [Synergistaceae bacterium]
MEAHPMVYGLSRLTDYDIYLFRGGNHWSLQDKLGAHETVEDGVPGVHFAVWAPNAQNVSVVGDFNEWRPDVSPLKPRWDSSGIWEGFLPGGGRGMLYKYAIEHPGGVSEKSDPFALRTEVPPRTASVVWSPAHEWQDEGWMRHRGHRNALSAPMSIYEVHLGSWKRWEGRSLSYRDLAQDLVPYVKSMGFTHVELLPVMEHPFYGSWGYQCTSFFAPTSRLGSPEDFMALVESYHREEIGVILDWVPSHFPTDGHGLGFFDGTHLFEYGDMRKGFHQDWSSYVFDYGLGEVRSFLISSALFWLQRYHADGLRVDAVASMLYLDYSRQRGEWVPNVYGGRENLEAMEFLRCLNTAIYERCPDVQTIAEESTAWPMVSRPTYVGGLGFGLKWNMGWMHDTLAYFSRDPIHRKHHHDQITFSLMYAFSENFCLALSHDEVVHGKKSLLGRMPGDEWQRAANLRLLLGYLFAHPGKKLLFMGGEFGQWQEWYHEHGLHWELLEYAFHAGIQRWVRDLNAVYRSHPALYEQDFTWEGFSWVDCHDRDNGVLSFLRYGRQGETLLVVFNMTPVPREHYRLGVPRSGWWKEILNSDGQVYGGGGVGNGGGLEGDDIPSHGYPASLSLTLPPLGVLFLLEGGSPAHA